MKRRSIEILLICGLSLSAPAPALSRDPLAEAEDLLKRFPHDAGAHFLLARARQRLGLVESALESYERGLALDPESAESWEGRGDILAQKGLPEEALAAYQRALSSVQGSGGAEAGRLKIKIGGELHSLGRLDEAEEILRGPAHGPAGDLSGSASFQLAQVVLARGRPEEAVPYLDRALERGEPAKNVYYTLARALQLCGRSAEAERARSRFKEEQAREKARKSDLALKSREEERLIRRNRAAVHFEAAGFLWGRRLHAEALEQLGRALAIDGDFAEALLARARYREEQGDAAGALEDYRALAQKNPRLADLPDFRRGLAAACRKRARELLTPPGVGPATVPEALELSRRAVELDPAAPSYEVHAWALLASKRRDEGLAALEQAARLDPGNADYRARLEALKKRGGPTE